MITFKILSRLAIEELKEEDVLKETSKYIVISISQPGQERPNIEHLHCPKLFLNFDDLEFLPQNQYPDLFKLFTNDMAIQILDFVNKNFNPYIIVHCQAGVCRSAAVAAALSKIMLNKDDEIFKTKIPNMLVYRKILQAWFEDPKAHIRWSNLNLIRNQNVKII